MIVPPQAVMLTAHVGDSLRCLIAKSRQAGVTRPALHKGPGDGAVGNCFWRSPPTPPMTTTTTIKGACFASKTITTISQRRRLAPRQRSRAAAHDKNSRTFFDFDRFDRFTHCGGPVLVAARCHHTLETHSRTHARTPNPRRKTIKNYSHTAAKETQKITKKRRKIHDHARTHRSSVRETLIVFVRFTLSACVSITCEKVTELGFNFTSLLLLTCCCCVSDC